MVLPIPQDGNSNLDDGRSSILKKIPGAGLSTIKTMGLLASRASGVSLGGGLLSQSLSTVGRGVGSIGRRFSKKEPEESDNQIEEKQDKFLSLMEKLVNTSEMQLEITEGLLTEEQKNRLRQERNELKLLEQEREKSRQDKTTQRGVEKKAKLKKASKDSEGSGGFFGSGVLFGLGRSIFEGIVGFGKAILGFLTGAFLFSLIKKGFVLAFKTIFKAGAILKVLSKLAIPATIAFSVGKGIANAFAGIIEGKSVRGILENFIFETIGTIGSLFGFDKDKIKEKLRKTVDEFGAGFAAIIIGVTDKFKKFGFQVLRFMEKSLNFIPGVNVAFTKEGEEKQLQQKIRENQENLNKTARNEGFLGIGKLTEEERNAELERLKKEQKILKARLEAKQKETGTLDRIDEQTKERRDNLNRMVLEDKRRRLQNKSIEDRENTIRNQSLNKALKDEKSNTPIVIPQQTPASESFNVNNNVNNTSQNFFSSNLTRNPDNTFLRNIDRDFQ